MNQHLQSSVFGSFQLEDELPEHPAYTAELSINGYGAVSITLAAVPDHEPDWSVFLRAAEKSHPVLLQHEPIIRKQAAPQVLSTHRDYYGDEWRGSAAELVSFFRLAQLNYFSDGSFELWYSGGDPFHNHDIRIFLNTDMRVTEVGLDG